MEKKKSEVETMKEKGIASAMEKNSECRDRDCFIHGHLKTHRRFFDGTVTKKFLKRVAIEFEKTVYVRKYERYAKSRTKIHARLPKCIGEQIEVGDYVRVQECRPLSKLIHFAVIEKINGRKLKEEEK